MTTWKEKMGGDLPSSGRDVRLRFLFPNATVSHRKKLNKAIRLVVVAKRINKSWKGQLAHFETGGIHLYERRLK